MVSTCAPCWTRTRSSGTHALLWYAPDAPELPARVKAVIEDSGNGKRGSVASFWEIAIKASRGRLPAVPDVLGLRAACLGQGFVIEPVSVEAVDAVSVEAVDAVSRMPSRSLPDGREHKDPFDRVIAATALTAGLSLVSADAAFDLYGVKRLRA